MKSPCVGQIYANYNRSIPRWNCLNVILKKIKLNFNECDTWCQKRHCGPSHVFTEFIDENLSASNLWLLWRGRTRGQGEPELRS